MQPETSVPLLQYGKGLCDIPHLHVVIIHPDLPSSHYAVLPALFACVLRLYYLVLVERQWRALYMKQLVVAH